MLKILTVTDEFTKAAIAIEIERSITGDHLVRILDRLAEVYGHQAFIRMGNGPEWTCNAILDWCRFSATRSVFIELGSPWQNAYVESFNDKPCDELLAIKAFHSQLEAKVMAEDYRTHYNTYGPHSPAATGRPRQPLETTGHWQRAIHDEAPHHSRVACTLPRARQRPKQPPRSGLCCRYLRQELPIQASLRKGASSFLHAFPNCCLFVKARQYNSASWLLNFPHSFQ